MGGKNVVYASDESARTNELNQQHRLRSAMPVMQSDQIVLDSRNSANCALVSLSR
jgi:hypothetical protein